MKNSANLHAIEIKAFVPSKNFQRTKQFYADVGFKLVSEGGGIAYFSHGHVSFLPQDFCAENVAENYMMHLLVADVEAWWAQPHHRDLPPGTSLIGQVARVQRVRCAKTAFDGKACPLLHNGTRRQLPLAMRTLRLLRPLKQPLF